MTIEIEDPIRGTMTASFSTPLENLNTYNGPLARVTIPGNNGAPDAIFITTSRDMINMLVDTLKNFRSVQ
jgi:hypothetical protein